MNNLLAGAIVPDQENNRMVRSKGFCYSGAHYLHDRSGSSVSLGTFFVRVHPLYQTAQLLLRVLNALKVFL